VSGQLQLPGAAMFEAAIAAYAQLYATTSTASSSPVLAGASIAGPLQLSHHGEALLELALNPGAGTLHAYSVNLVSAARQLHLRTSAALCSRGTAADAAAAGGSSVTSSPVQRHSWASVVLREAVADLARFDGGALAALDARQDQPGSG
jgi:hypothetical protein